MNKINYNPDVLDCLSNLSNDEVFTSPELANKIIDLLPQELFSNKEAKFLDPFCKSGVFLREIAKRLNKGLEKEIPNLQQRLDHIFHNQLFGIAITELTSLLSRRSLYCSKYPNFKYSISKFDNVEGNIRFRKTNHTWRNNKCVYCGASKSEYNREDSLESYAYEFIHNENLEEIFNMKFDVIIGNPPYQLSDGGNGSSATPIYNLFVEQAKKLNPRYLIMIIPSRWMIGGKGLDGFRDIMLHDKRICELHDFTNSNECFPGIQLPGGVCYFLWNRDSKKECAVHLHSNEITIDSNRYLVEPNDDIHIRFPIFINIIKKISKYHEQKFSSIVSAAKAYGLRNDFFKNPKKYLKPDTLSDTEIKNGYRILGLENAKRTYKYVEHNYPFNKDNNCVDKYKVFIAEAYGCSAIGENGPTSIISEPILGNVYDICTETFLEIGPFKNRVEAENCMAYIKTKFFRVLVGIRKITQHTTQKVYQYVPLVDLQKKWTDEELYKKYNLSNEEIEFIEKNIRQM